MFETEASRPVGCGRWGCEESKVLPLPFSCHLFVQGSPGSTGRRQGKDGELLMLEPQPPELVVGGCKACSEQGRNLRFRRCCCSTDTLQRCSDRNKVPHPSLLTSRKCQCEHSPISTKSHGNRSPRFCQIIPKRHYTYIYFHLFYSLHHHSNLPSCQCCTISQYLPALRRGKIHFPLSALRVTAPFSQVIAGAHPGLPNPLLLVVPADRLGLGQGEEALLQQGIRNEAALEPRKEHY